jgi:hypothetical protein
MLRVLIPKGIHLVTARFHLKKAAFLLLIESASNEQMMDLGGPRGRGRTEGIRRGRLHEKLNDDEELCHFS